MWKCKRQTCKNGQWTHDSTLTVTATGCQKLTPHTHTHPTTHIQRHESDLLAGVRGESRFWIQSLVSVGLSPAWTNPLSSECVCVITFPDHLPAPPPELCLRCDTICHFIPAKPRQQNVLLGSEKLCSAGAGADCLSTHTTTQNHTNCCYNSHPTL